VLNHCSITAASSWFFGCVLCTNHSVFFTMRFAFLALLCCCAVSFIAAQQFTKLVDMRVLLVSGSGNDSIEPTVGGTRLMLNAMGVPFDEFVVSTAGGKKLIFFFVVLTSLR